MSNLSFGLSPKISERAGGKKPRIQKARATPARFASSDGSASSIKDLATSWLCLAKTALRATKSLHKLTLLVSRDLAKKGRVEQ